MNCARNRSATRRPHVGAEIFAIAPGVEYRELLLVERLKNVVCRGQNLPALGGLESCRLWGRRFGRGRPACRFPRLNTAIQHPNVWVTEELQEPKSPCRSHAGILFVEDDLLVITYAAQFKDVMDHVHECLKRRFPCVNQAEAKKIKMNRARNMPLGKLFRRPHIDQTEVR